MVSAVFGKKGINTIGSSVCYHNQMMNGMMIGRRRMVQNNGNWIRSSYYSTEPKEIKNQEEVQEGETKKNESSDIKMLSKEKIYSKHFSKYLNSVSRKLGYKDMPEEFQECEDFILDRAKHIMYAKKYTPVTDSGAFPSNPLFKPQRPLGNDIRKSIFKKFQEDPSVWTPLKLAHEYGISIERVKAIIRLRALAKSFENPPKGINKRALQTDLTKNMEGFLNPVTPKSDNRLEPIHIVRVKTNVPLYQLVDEHESGGFTPEDAARILEKVPFLNILTVLNRSANKKVSTENERAGIDVPNISTGNKKRGFLIQDVGIRPDDDKTSTFIRLNNEKKCRVETTEEKLQRIKITPSFRP